MMTEQKVQVGLDTLERQFDSGDGHALMRAIALCASQNHVLPDWVRRAYLAAYGKIAAFEAKSWDDVFGKPYPKGTNLSATKKRVSVRWDVLVEVHRVLRLNPGTPIDEELFERVGKKFNIGRALAAEYYYDAKKMCGF